MSFINHLDVERIDFCEFGNSVPFRIRIINRINDNYDHYYIKAADASRIYGLELEDLLSPNRITFLTHKDTLVEEHIAGIPGDMFLEDYLHLPETNKIRIAKEFVKFNERCFARLLGDMRSYNFVVDITPDIEDYQYRLRAIDFDQQSYEGRKNLYLPQFYRENYEFVELVLKTLSPEVIKQYQMEEQTAMAYRVVTSSKSRFVTFNRPVAGRVGRQHFVHERQGAIFIQTKLELGVGNDDAFGQRKRSRQLVNLDADFFDLCGEFRTNNLDDLFVAYVFIVLANLRFCRGCKNRLGQLAGIAQPGRQWHTADSLSALVFLPATASQIAAHHRFNRNRLEPLDQHRATFNL